MCKNELNNLGLCDRLSQVMGLLVLCLLFVPSILAQNPYIFRLNKSTGLPSNSVYNVFQDSKGYIWLATDEGLSMYDGFKYTTFKSDAQTSTAGSCIQEDALGRIWYENFDGYLYFVDAKRKELSKFNQSKSIGYIPYGITKNHIFLFQNDGIAVYNIRDLSLVKRIPFVPNRLEHANCDGKDYYFIENDKLYRLTENLELTSSNYVFDAKELTKQIYLNGKDLIVVSKLNENEKLHVFDQQLNYKFDLALTVPKFIHGATFIDNQYWISTPEGVVVLNDKGKYKTYFEDKSISAVIKDRQNNYWFSTTDEGVFVVPDLMNTAHSLNNIHPKKIVKLNNGNLLIGAKNGELVLASHDLTSYKTVYQSPNRNEIEYVYVDPNNQFIAFVSKGLTILRAQDYVEIRNLNFSLKEICAIDSVYFGFAASGLYGVFKNPVNASQAPSSWDTFLEQFEMSTALFWQFSINVRARAVAFDEKKDVLYYGTNIGLFKITKSKTHEIKLNNESVYASKIFTHKNDLYVLLTRGNFFKIKQNGDFELLNQRFDIPEFEVKLVKRFDDKLVFSSHKNLHSLNLNSGEHKVYRTDIAPYEINDFLLDKQILFLITDEGIIKTAANFIESIDKGASLFYINDFQIQSVSRNIGEKISVSYNQNQMSINFSILDFGKSQTAALYQQLNNGPWEVIPAETRSINFPNLAPGDYHIRFKLGDEIQEQDLKFIIRSPFWRTWWFILLMILFVIGIGMASYFYKKHQLVKKLALLEEKIELEKNLSKSILTSIKAQMNPHFFYNALNTIQAYIFTNDPDNASKYLSKFSKLTRKILEMSEAELVQLGEEIDTLTLYLELEQARFDDDFTFQIEVDKGIDLDMTRIPPMLIQPYVENAVKHGLLHKTGDKNVQIRFEKIDIYIQISIEDNGVGRRTSGELNSIKNAKHKSFATDANAKRLDVLNQGSGSKVTFEIIDKVDVNQVPLGTLVILKIPML